MVRLNYSIPNYFNVELHEDFSVGYGIMKTEVIDGKKIMIFEDREELKWYYHKLLCKGDATAQYMMEQCVDEETHKTVKDVNKWLERRGEPCRVKEA